MAMTRSLIRLNSPRKITDTPVTTPVMLGRMSDRIHSSVAVTDSRLGRMSAFSHCSREAAKEAYTDRAADWMSGLSSRNVRSQLWKSTM